MNNDFAGYSDLLVQFITDSDERAYIVFSVPPKMTLQQCSTSVNESDNALLYCNATGNPVPNLAWIREKVREVVSQNIRRWSCQVLNAMSQDYISALLGMELGTTSPRTARLTFTVSFYLYLLSLCGQGKEM